MSVVVSVCCMLGLWVTVFTWYIISLYTLVLRMSLRVDIQAVFAHCSAVPLSGGSLHTVH